MRFPRLAPLALTLALALSASAPVLAQSNPVPVLPQAALVSSSYTFNLGGLASMGEPGDPENVILSQFLGAGALITGFEFSLTLTTVEESYLNEAFLRLANSAGNSFALAPFAAFLNESGTRSLTGSYTLASSEQITLGADGQVTLSLLEDFNDYGGPDANYGAGSRFTVFFDSTAPIPEPGSALLMGLGLAGLTAWARRRRAAP